MHMEKKHLKDRNICGFFKIVFFSFLIYLFIFPLDIIYLTYVYIYNGK